MTRASVLAHTVLLFSLACARSAHAVHVLSPGRALTRQVLTRPITPGARVSPRRTLNAHRIEPSRVLFAVHDALFASHYGEGTHVARVFMRGSVQRDRIHTFDTHDLPSDVHVSAHTHRGFAHGLRPQLRTWRMSDGAAQ